MNKIRSMAAALALAIPAMAIAANDIAMHRDPGCGCCAKWAGEVRKRFGRAVRIIDDANRASLQKSSGIPPELSSCHTAIIDGYVFEGHVPIADMKRFLGQRPKGLKGLAVAGMPLGSPGMEVHGHKAQSYDVFAFGPAGRKLYARH